MRKYRVSICLASNRFPQDVTADGYRVLENGDVYFFHGDPKEGNVILTVARGHWLFIEELAAQ